MPAPCAATPGSSSASAWATTTPCWGLFRRWGLPLVIGRFRYHHAPLSAENLDHDTLSLVRFVCAADTLAKAAGIGSSGDDGVEEIPERVWQLLSVDQKAAQDLVALARRTVSMQKMALGSAPLADPAAGLPILLLIEGTGTLSLTAFALEAAGFAPRITRSWGDALQTLSADPGIRALLWIPIPTRVPSPDTAQPWSSRAELGPRQRRSKEASGRPPSCYARLLRAITWRGLVPGRQLLRPGPGAAP